MLAKVQIAFSNFSMCQTLEYILRKGDIVANLTRYGLRSSLHDLGTHFVETPTGEYVKFEDVKEFLKTPSNTGNPKLPDLRRVYHAANVDPCRMEHNGMSTAIHRAYDFIAEQLRVA